MQKNQTEPAVTKGPAKALKYALLGFVGLSIAAAGYKVVGTPCCDTGGNSPAAVETPAAAGQTTSAAKTPVAAVKKAAEARKAVVYYFYTDARCSSCKTIEEYTRAAVEKDFSSEYKGWKVVFKGVNIDEAPNGHYKQDYWLNTKSVVVQKFSGDKALKWGKLEKVWQLLDDKDAFVNYVSGETKKLLDEK